MGKTYRREKDIEDGYSGKNKYPSKDKKSFKKISKKLRKQRKNNHNYGPYDEHEDDYSMYHR